MSITRRMGKHVNTRSRILYNNVKKKKKLKNKYSYCISLSKKKPKISTHEFLCSSNTGKMILRDYDKNSSNKSPPKIIGLHPNLKSRNTINKVKRLPTEQEKIFAYYICDT